MESRSLVELISEGCSLETVKKLVESGASVNDRHYFDYPLDAAVHANNPELVKFLLKYVDYDITETYHGRDKTVLHRACEADHPNPELVKAILEYGINVNYVDQYGETALHLACLRRNKEIVQLLIDYGIDINFVEEGSDCCSSAIYYAICKETTEIFELLLKHGAEIFLVTCSNNSVYHAATSAPEIAKLILKYTVNLSSVSKVDWNILSCAVFNNDLNLVKQLIENGHEVDMLCVYAAAVAEDEEMLEVVWKHAAPEMISDDLYFMMHVFDNWNYKEPLDKLLTLLKKEGVDLHLERCGKAFAFFIDRRAKYVFQDVSSEKQRTLMTTLFNRGLRLSVSDTERIISSMYYSGSSELLHNIINIFLPKISRLALLKACENSVDKILLQYCLEADFNVLFDIERLGWTLENIKYYHSRFTLTEPERLIYYLERYGNLDAKLINEISVLLKSNNFKSLVELSRDAVRKHLNHICKDSRQMLLIFDRLQLPVPIRDIIQCKTPVNRLETT